MRRLRQTAFVILFAGWMLPAFLAQSARERAPRQTGAQPPTGALRGLEPAPPAAQRMGGIFRTIAGIWVFVALVYAGTLTIRFRRTLLS